MEVNRARRNKFPGANKNMRAVPDLGPHCAPWAAKMS